MLIIVVLGFMYTLITGRSGGRSSLTVSRKATLVLTVLFILAIILVLLAYLILNLDPVQALKLVLVDPDGGRLVRLPDAA